MEVEYREEVIELLQKAFDENRDDPVSLMTIIEMYGNEFDEDGSSQDIEVFLTQLADLLKSNSAIVKEIGWDLPKLLLQFFAAKNISTADKLENNQIIISVIKCINEVAQNGNPKECLLTCSDILNELSFSKEEEDESVGKEENDERADEEENDKTEISHFKNNAELQSDFIPNMKIYVLFQFITKILMNIETLYPSKFLVIFVSSVIKCFKINQNLIENAEFLLTRIYEFAINYKPHFIEFSSKLEISQKEYENIVADEKLLVDKLIKQLVTLSLSVVLKNMPLDLDLIFYKNISASNSEFDLRNGWLENIAMKFITLVYGLEINMADEFTRYLNEIEVIYKPICDGKKAARQDVEDSENQAIYQLSYTYSMNKQLKKQELELDPYGITILSGLYYIEENKHLISRISIKNAIYLYLSTSTASLFSENFNHKAVEGIGRYWLWVAVTTIPSLKLKESFEQIPTVVSKTFLQMLLLKNCLQTNNGIRNITFTLLTRILCLLPENVSFEFIIDTLLTCPYTNAKIVMLKILKDLLQKSSSTITDEDQNIAELEDGIKYINIGTEKRPPTLPSRPYITLDEDKMASLHSLVLSCIEQVFIAKEPDMKRYQSLLLCYMNFFVSLRFKWNKDLLHDLMTTVNEKLASKTEDYKEQNELQFIKIANESIESYLSQ